MNKIEEQYIALLNEILEDGVVKEDRTGTGTRSLFGRQIRHNMKDGFPLLTTKRMAVKTMMTELKWFLKGDTNIKYLVDNNCNIWNGDAYQKYCLALKDHYDGGGDIATQDQFIRMIKDDKEFSDRFGNLGPIYGKQWRDWDGRQELDGSYDMSLDQIANLIFQLKRNPDSRRLMVNAWNVGELSEMTLPPCHYGFQMYTRVIDGQRYLSLMWNQRSCDVFLGIPFNISSYAALLCLIAEEVNMIPDQLIGNLGDTHLYSNHLEQAKEQASREIYPLPTVEFSNVDLLGGEFDFEIKDYKYHPSIKAPLSN